LEDAWDEKNDAIRMALVENDSALLD